eukprot:Colp12_sorted_trinity150504_noHs@18915
MDLLRSRLFPGAFRAAFNFAAVQMRTQVRTGYTSSKPTFRKTSPEPVILKEKLAELPLIAHARPKTLRPLQVVKGAKATSLVATLNSSIQSEEQKSLFAVVQLAGKQFKVTKNDIVVVNKLKVDVGAQIKLEKVLMLGSPSVSVIGTPLIDKVCTLVCLYVFVIYIGTFYSYCVYFCSVVCNCWRIHSPIVPTAGL